MPSTSSAVRDGVLYTEHLNLKAAGPIGSLWSFRSMADTSGRPAMAVNADGNQEFWLDRSDPLLNTILPGTGATVVVNFADRWSFGRSLRTASELPPIFVVGPVLRPRLLRVGPSVRAIGAAFPAIFTTPFLGVGPAQLLDQIVPLHALWPLDHVETLERSLAEVPTTNAVTMLRDLLMAKLSSGVQPEHMARQATQQIRQQGGRVSISRLARIHGLSRQKFARQFCEATGMSPKLYARITRFQSLIGRLLASDVSQWVEVSSEAGFYDQAHMINEFRELAGVSPIDFFRRQDGLVVSGKKVHGRPSEWKT